MSLSTCLTRVCVAAARVRLAAEDAIEELEALEAATNALADIVVASGLALQCVINGPADRVCQLPLDGSLPTLANAIANLNLTSIAGLTLETVTAIGGETSVVSSNEIQNTNYLEVCLDGARLSYPTDYWIESDMVTVVFPHELEAGDQVSMLVFTI